jgi:acetyl esterase/lipase
MDIVIVFVLLFLAGGLALTAYLRGADLRQYDDPSRGELPSHRQHFSTGKEPNTEHQTVVESLVGVMDRLKGKPRREHLGLLRAYMESLADGRVFQAQFLPVQAGTVPAEWVLAPGADPTRRTLYIHGGGWIMGSARSHRVITAKFSEITGGAVLAIDYRLMPEHSRMAGVEDCRMAYHWMLENGPQGRSPAQTVFVAGDSAGGNLTLSLLPWVRSQGLRPPDAAVALSPATDATLGSPSMRANVATDAMLGPLFGKLARIPRSVLLWAGWVQGRIRPSHPSISPVFGDLSGLPPTLIHASEIEMLLDDSVRYANKAAACGSEVQLQTWDHVVHVWHIFDPELTEARLAFEEIRRFLHKHVGRVAAN